MTNTCRSSLKPFSLVRALVTFAIASSIIFGAVQLLGLVYNAYC